MHFLKFLISKEKKEPIICLRIFTYIPENWNFTPVRKFYFNKYSSKVKIQTLSIFI